MFNDEVVKIETDKLCAIVNEMRRVSFMVCESLGNDVHRGDLSVAGAHEIFNHQVSRMIGAFDVLEESQIISAGEYMELCDKWIKEANRRFYDSLHCQKDN